MLVVTSEDLITKHLSLSAEGHQLSECVYGNTTVTKDKNGNPRVSCWCGDHSLYRLNVHTHTCDLVATCSAEGVGGRECAARNALCVLQGGDKLTDFRCECAPGQHYNESMVCVDHCDDARISEQCAGRAGRCNALVPAGSAQLNLAALTIEQMCTCAEGTRAEGQGDDFRCAVASSQVLHTTMTLSKLSYTLSKSYQSFVRPSRYLESKVSMAFTTNAAMSPWSVPNENLLQYLNESKTNEETNLERVSERIEVLKTSKVEQHVSELLVALFQQDNDLDKKVEELRVLSCQGVQDNSASTVECKVQMILTPGTKVEVNQSIAEDLVKKCQPFRPKGGDTEMCVLKLDRQHNQNESLDDQRLLIMPKESEKLQFKKFAPCEEHGKTCPEYTKCVDDKSKIAGNVTYECQCRHSPLLEHGRINIDLVHLGAIQECRGKL